MLTKESIKQFSASGLDSITDIVTEPAPKNAGIMVFPRELREDNKNWPCVSFSAENQFVFLPIPPGMSFSDNIAYNSINLGLLGSAAIGAFDQMTKAITSGDVRGGIRSIAEDTKAKFKSGNAAAAAAIMAKGAAYIPNRLAGLSAGSGLIDYANRQVLAPNTNTAFESPAIRSFNFIFKMAALEKADSEAMRNIVSFFRKYAYPEGNTVLLKYPPIWSIKFYNGVDRNPYIPGIYGCYLTSMNTVYNSSTNMFHEDGSPIEIDIQLTFQETKVLTRLEVDKLNKGEG